jgi:hypothetical protein
MRFKLPGSIGRAEVRSGLNRGFSALGTPSFRGIAGGGAVDPKVALRRGRRRAAIGGGVLGLNAMVGPRGGQSSGSRGYVNPHSTGGFA